MSKGKVRVLWEKGALRIVEREDDWWMAGNRKVHRLWLERRNSAFQDSWWSSLKSVSYLSWPHFQFFSRREAIAFLRGVADAITR